MNRSQLSRKINELEGELSTIKSKLPDDPHVRRALELVAEIERLKGEHMHLTRRLQQSGLMI
jgi:hypothetical protein